VNQSQIYSLAKNAGLPDDKARIAAAIAMAESGGNPNDLNDNPGTGDLSYGLWQINMIGSMGPSRRAMYGLSKNEDLFNPVINARVMSAISHQGQNFTAWSTYKDGKYNQYLTTSVAWVPVPTPFGTVPVPTSPGDVAGAVTGGLSDAVGAAVSAGNAVVSTGKWVSNPRNWVRVGYVIGGSVLVIVGLGHMLSQTGAGQAVVSGTKKVVSTGKKVAVAATA